MPTRTRGTRCTPSDRVWVEKNCYVDIWIEFDPRARAASRWRCCRSSSRSTSRATSGRSSSRRTTSCATLYGIDVQELNCWRPLLEHAQEHLARRQADQRPRPMRSGCPTRRAPTTGAQHTKTTIVLDELDARGAAARLLPQRRLLRARGRGLRDRRSGSTPPDPAFMPFFAELVRIDRLVRRAAAELTRDVGRAARRHLARRPRDESGRAVRRAVRARPARAAGARAGALPRVGVRHGAPARRGVRS